MHPVWAITKALCWRLLDEYLVLRRFFVFGTKPFVVVPLPGCSLLVANMWMQPAMTLTNHWMHPDICITLNSKNLTRVICYIWSSWIIHLQQIPRLSLNHLLPMRQRNLMRRTVATARHPTALLVAAIVTVIRAKAANIRKRDEFSTHWRHQSALQGRQIGHSSISTAQGCQLVSPLPPAPWALTSTGLSFSFLRLSLDWTPIPTASPAALPISIPTFPLLPMLFPTSLFLNIETNLILYLYPEKCIKFNQSESRIFEVLRAISDYIQKWQKLSNLENPVFDFSLLYARKNSLRRKSKVCSMDTQIK